MHLSRIRYTLTDMATTTERIANKVRGAAAESGFTQQRIADTIGISRASVVERINGRVPFTGSEIFALANAMGLPVERFFPDLERSLPSERVA